MNDATLRLHPARRPEFWRQLESFVRSRVAREAEWLGESFTVPAEPPALARSDALRSFQWEVAVIAGQLRTFGIRPLIEEPFFSIAALEQQGFAVSSTRSEATVSGDGGAGHFWIAEVVSSRSVLVWSCAHVPPNAWYVLDEHAFEQREREANRDGPGGPDSTCRLFVRH